MTTSYTHNNKTITIDLLKDAKLSKAGVAIMQDRYLLKDYDKTTQEWTDTEGSPQECFARASCEFGSDEAHAQRMYNYASKNWMMFATPILTNAGTKRGLPISCFLGQTQDSMEQILAHHYETGFLASYGGGVGSDWSKLRSSGSGTSRGNVTTGVIPFIRMMDTQMSAVQQGSTRRGAYAAYIDISHPEVEEFIELRTPQGGDPQRRCLGTGFHHALNIPDKFMDAVSAGETWDLVDPHSKEVRNSIDARSLWMKILTKRLETGEPYLHFIDTSNKALPEHLKEKGLRINNSNLCNEIFLPTSEDRTAVCCLSSVNLEYYDDWKDNKIFIADMVEFLDNVLTSFIEKAPKQMWRAVNSARNSRDIGIGAMGMCLYLQKRGIPFETPMALGQSKLIFKHIKEKAMEANLLLGTLRGEAPDAQGTGKRCSHLMAVAPNANIGIICGNTSPSIEPYNANAFNIDTLSGTFMIKNKELDRVLRDIYNLEGNALDIAWSSIIKNEGSVQQLDFLTDLHKEVFKTALELDQLYIIEHASVRQEFICQGQSVNIFLSPDIHKSDLHKIHMEAWKKGLKGLYYCRSESIRKNGQTLAELKDTSVEVNFSTEDDTGCLACEG